MQIHAVSLGQAVPRQNFDAVVQSVFDSAVNLRLMQEDRLITLLVSDHYELPQGIRINQKGLPFSAVAVGRRVATRNGVLRFGSPPLTVDLRGASVWECRVPHLLTDMRAASTQAAWAAAWKALNKGQRLRSTDILADDLLHGTPASSLSQRMSAPMMNLIAATERFDLKASLQAAQQMIGLGTGVTPSGDDILIGYLAGLWSRAGANQTLVSYLQSFGPALMQIAAETNEISRTYLYHATRGGFSSSLSNLAEVIARGDDVDQAMQIAMRVGHSSGMDSVTGLLIGLSVLPKEYSLGEKAPYETSR
jgi:hypothetical protein